MYLGHTPKIQENRTLVRYPQKESWLRPGSGKQEAARSAGKDIRRLGKPAASWSSLKTNIPLSVVVSSKQRRPSPMRFEIRMKSSNKIKDPLLRQLGSHRILQEMMINVNTRAIIDLLRKQRGAEIIRVKSQHPASNFFDLLQYRPRNGPYHTEGFQSSCG